MAALPFDASSTSWPASASPRARPRPSASWSSAPRILPIVHLAGGAVAVTTVPALFDPLVCARHRQRDAKPRARIRSAVDVDAPVVRVDDLANDRQTEAGAGDLGREERIEDAIGHV